jgi:hypothetical protein
MAKQRKLDFTGIESWEGITRSLFISNIKFKYPIWTEEGLFMQGIVNNEAAAMHLQWLNVAKMELLHRFFIDHEITFEKDQESGIEMISINLWDKPISFFNDASEKKQEKIIEYIRKYDWQLFEFWQRVFNVKYSDDDILAEYCCIGDMFMGLEKELTDSSDL